MRLISHRTLPIAFLLMISGCSLFSEKDNPIQLSFESLGSDYDVRGDAQGHQNRTSVNITGLSLPVAVGQTVTSPGGKLTDLLALPISAQCSKIVVTKFDTDAQYEDVIGIKSSLDSLTESSLDLAAIDIQLTLSSVALTKVKGKSAAEISLDSQALAIMNSIGAKSNDEQGVAAAQMTLLAAKVSAQQKISSLLLELRRLGGKKNLMVARWSVSDQASGGVTIGSILSSNGSASTKLAGYVVLAGIRDSSIKLGRDFVTRVQVEKAQYENNREANDMETMFGDPYVVLFTRAAKYVAYSEQVDFSAALTAKLKLSPEQMASLSSGGVLDVLKQQELALDVMVATALAAANQGGLSTPTREEYEYRFWAREVRAKSIEEEEKRLQGYSIVYHNRATVIQARNRIKGSTAEFNDCMHVVPRAGSLDTVGTESLGNKFCLPLRADVEKTGWQQWKPNRSRCIELNKNLLSQ